MAENAYDSEYWDSRADAWANREGMLERFTEDLGRVGIDALAPASGERVLDVGCGPGSTTIDLAGRVGAAGDVVGLEISPAMVASAERRAADIGVGNARFVVHDLEQAPLVEGFDAAYSRFGVMFFARPDAAFSNLVASLRPGGRFAAVVWASPQENPWMAITNATAADALGIELSPPAPGGPGPFSLSDPDSLVTLLQGAGLVDVGVERALGRLELHQRSVDFEVASLLGIGPLGKTFAAADDEVRAAAVAAVLAASEPHRTAEGWELPGCALVATGVRPD
jgi:SAM-dependent methyltransferase